MSTESNGKRFPLHWRILIALLLGAMVGGTVNAIVGRESENLRWLVENVTKPIGMIFLRMLILTVVPLVFCSLALGVTRLGDLGRLGRMGLKTFAFFLLTMTIGVTIGLTLVNTIQPGKAIPDETRDRLQAEGAADAARAQEQAAQGFSFNTLLEDIVPANPIKSAAEGRLLGVITVSLLTGIALTYMSKERAEPLIGVMEAVGEVTVWIIGLAMRIAPLGVFCLIFSTTAIEGFGVMVTLGLYVVVVLLGLGIQVSVTLPILLRVLGKWNPLDFFSRIRSPILTAFSTSSSSATLPTSIRAAEEQLGVSKPVAGFVLPLGATMNMNGTALFEGVTVVFLAQVFGPDLTFSQQILVVILCVVTAVGAAGVPGGSIPMLIMVMTTVGVRPDAIALILGVDRILDMCRTTVNVIGDLAATAVVARSEGEISVPPENGSTPPVDSNHDGKVATPKQDVTKT